MESMDDLLAQLRAEYNEKDNHQPKKPQPLPQEIWQEMTVSPPPPVPKMPTKSILFRSEDKLITELKSEFESQEQAEAQKKQQQLFEEQQRQEQLKQQQQQALKQEAEVWLKQLKPRSTEGLWFEEFAQGYPSKLEAAIVYLQALKEVNP
jgi:hypothetical protein